MPSSTTARRLLPLALAPLAAVAIVLFLRGPSTDEGQPPGPAAAPAPAPAGSEVPLTLPEPVSARGESHSSSSTTRQDLDDRTGEFWDMVRATTHLPLESDPTRATVWLSLASDWNAGGQGFLAGTCTFVCDDAPERRAAPGHRPSVTHDAYSERAVRVVLEPGRWIVEARAEGFVGEPEIVELVAGQQHPLVIEMLPVAEVVGLVRDERTGAPIAGATVWTPSATSMSVHSGADGRFRLTHAPANEALIVHARAPGHGGGAAFVTAAREEVVILLSPGKTVRGRLAVRDPGAASVRVAGVASLAGGAGGQDGDVVQPAADGSFVVPDLRSDVTHTLTAEAPGCNALVVEIPAREGTVDLGTLLLDVEASLSGRVTTASGEPARGVRVLLRPERPLDGEAERSCTTDEDGRYATDSLRPGRWLAIVQGVRAEVARSTVEIVAGPTYEDLVIAGDARVLRGRIDPVPLDTEGLRLLLFDGAIGIGKVPIAADGTFAVLGLDVDDGTSVAVERTGAYPTKLGSASCKGLQPGAELVVPVE